LAVEIDVTVSGIDAADAEYVEATIDEVYCTCWTKRWMVSI